MYCDDCLIYSDAMSIQVAYVNNCTFHGKRYVVDGYINMHGGIINTDLFYIKNRNNMSGDIILSSSTTIKYGGSQRFKGLKLVGGRVELDKLIVVDEPIEAPQSIIQVRILIGISFICDIIFSYNV